MRSHLQEEPSGNFQAQARGEETFGFAPAQQLGFLLGRAAGPVLQQTGACPGGEAVTPHPEEPPV